MLKGQKTMRALLSCLLVVPLTASALPADDKPSDKDKTPAKVEFEKLHKEFEATMKKFNAEIRKEEGELQELMADKDKKDDEKKAAQKKFTEKAMRGAQQQQQFGLRFLELAQKFPRDPAGLDALDLALGLSGGPAVKNGAYAKVIAAYKPRVAEPRIKKSIGNLAKMALSDGSAGEVLKDVMAKNPDRKIQGMVCKTLIQVEQRKASIAGQLKESELGRKNLEGRVGKETVEKFMANAANAEENAEALKKTLHTKYADLYPDLSIGKPAPEVVIQDVDGKKARLSALKGRVVVLDIWATWCGPCRAMIPHSREMVERLKDKPFTLVSISADTDKKTLTDFLAKEKMPWTHWWNGDEGGIVEDWEVEHFPTVYVIDAKGIIRHKELRGEELEKAVNDLLKEIEETKSE
jgi:thiol-disulfide isomerase/thioredoxin